MTHTTKTTRKSTLSRGTTVLLAFITLALVGCATLMGMQGPHATPPPASEFGLGPRASAQRLYTATLESDAPLRTRALQTVRVRVTDANGQALDGATIDVNGGMPQHGHGLPTAPRVTANTGGGLYVVEGVRFNMGGWWEFKLTISSAAGTDMVTFNLKL